MINQKEISTEWLNQVAKQHRNADKILAEKVIRALLLLESLPLTFKRINEESIIDAIKVLDMYRNEENRTYNIMRIEESPTT